MENVSLDSPVVLSGRLDSPTSAEILVLESPVPVIPLLISNINVEWQ